MIGYEVFGGGPEKVIVLPGWASDHTLFEMMRPALSAEDFAFAFVDYRGCGLSKDQTGEYTIREMATDAIEVANHLGWPAFHLIGHSMGGMVLQWIAADFSARVRSSVAVTPVAACGNPGIDKATSETWQKATDDPEQFALLLQEGIGNRHLMSWARALARQAISNCNHDALVQYFKAFNHTDFVQKVQGLAIPLKVLVGENDPWVTTEGMRQTVLKWFTKSEIEVLQNAGHLPMIEIPINFATVCQKYMMQRHSG